MHKEHSVLLVEMRQSQQDIAPDVDGQIKLLLLQEPDASTAGNVCGQLN